MILTFKTDVPVTRTMQFDSLYEKKLQFDIRYKRMLIRKGIALWVFVDGKIAGEIYGISPRALDEIIEDVSRGDRSSIYCYSTTILREFQGQGLGKVLKAYWLGLAASQFRVCTGHSTAPAMVAVNEYFGAVHSVKHEDWYGTKRTAWFYRLQLP
jgi:GNAT superfamily N-acetyltransferase